MPRKRSIYKGSKVKKIGGYHSDSRLYTDMESI